MEYAVTMDSTIYVVSRRFSPLAQGRKELLGKLVGEKLAAGEPIDREVDREYNLSRVGSERSTRNE